jgi:hypothetical protein
MSMHFLGSFHINRDLAPLVRMIRIMNRNLSAEARGRLAWMDAYRECGNAALVCRLFAVPLRTFSIHRVRGTKCHAPCGYKVYFVNAHRPWERGTNEKANGRLQRAFPKGFDFAKVDQNDVDGVVWIMNHAPRKCLGWRTPCAVYERCCTSS